jgi:alkanesulfonate monooxygenase SsuD/methylene tetrahydromethanopterin reductase-like flavin-dependent oxidoreductase (luciferase family)
MVQRCDVEQHKGLPMKRIRFCAYQYANRPFPELAQRWRRAEELGFDVLWNCDALNEPDHRGMIMFEASTILTAMAMHTSHIRIGTLVNTLIYRNPAVVAKTAMTIDHVSGGRLELGFGGGVQASDHTASGIAWWPARERVARFREAVHLVDQLLRNEVTSWSGEYYRVQNAETSPRPIQQPRPPLTIPAHGPSMLRVAAEHADSWSSWGGYQIETEPQMFTVTRERCKRFDDLCVELGRDPATIRHSLVCFPPLTPWDSVDYFGDMIARYHDIGIDEFVLYWPQTWRARAQEDRVFEEIADLMPALRK